MTAETQNPETQNPEMQNKNAEPVTETEAQTASTEKPDAPSSENLNPEQRKAYLDNEAGDSEEAEDSPQALKDQLLRVMADNENLRKRTERDILAAKKYGALGLARDLLGSIDNLETAISHMPENRDDMDETLKNILIGVEMSARELATVLERHHIKKVTPEMEKFDYNLHQAMFEVPTDDVEPGMVVQVVQSGYVLHDRLLRPAMVGVSKAAVQAAPDTTDTETDK